ncbi:hypothetical protein D3C79_962690 [compost metagenome]
MSIKRNGATEYRAFHACQFRFGESVPNLSLKLPIHLVPACCGQRDFGEAALGTQATERRGKEEA